MNQTTLDTIREEIDLLDRELLKLLSLRKKKSLKALKCKLDAANGVSSGRDLKREQNILTTRKEAGIELGLSPGFVERLFHIIIEESLQTQKGSSNSQA